MAPKFSSFQTKSWRMLPIRPLTSRQTYFRPHPPPDKRKVTIEEMLHMSYEAGAGRTIREIASSSCRSPTTVARYVSLARSGQQQPKEPDTKSALEQVIRHFVLYCLLRNPLVSGALVSSHLSWIGLQASRAKVNRIARDLNFVSVYQSKRDSFSAPLRIPRKRRSGSSAAFTSAGVLSSLRATRRRSWFGRASVPDSSLVSFGWRAR